MICTTCLASSKEYGLHTIHTEEKSSSEVSLGQLGCPLNQTVGFKFHPVTNMHFQEYLFTPHGQVWFEVLPILPSVMIQIRKLVHIAANELRLLSPELGWPSLEAEVLSLEVPATFNRRQMCVHASWVSDLPNLMTSFVFFFCCCCYIKWYKCYIWIIVHFKKPSMSIRSMTVDRAWKLNFLPFHVTSLKSSTM